MGSCSFGALGFVLNGRVVNGSQYAVAILDKGVKVQLVQVQVQSESSEYIAGCFFEQLKACFSCFIELWQFFYQDIFRVGFFQFGIVFYILPKMPKFFEVCFFFVFGTFLSKRGVTSLSSKPFYLVGFF